MTNTIRTTKSVLSAVLLVGAAAALSACVTTPYNDEWVDASAVDFSGYAQDPGATIEISGFDKQTNTWVVLDETITASSTPTNYGGETLYRWTASDLNTIATGDCFWGEGAACYVPAGSANARFRVKEVGGRTLVTFDQGGTSCVLDEVSAGAGWFAAGLNCASDSTPAITLWTLT